jgi:transcriptional regulator
MYMPPHFVESNSAEIRSLIEAFPLAVLVAHTAEGIVANHIPIMMLGEDVLVGHIALNNELHKLLQNGEEVLTIFKGDDSYVSPNYYPSKPIHHKHVPTWNYQVVHIYGRISFQHDKKSKIAAVGMLTKLHETRINGSSGWRMSDAPKDYMATMIDSIVGFRIEIDRVLGKSKLSQNRETKDFEQVAKTLHENGEARLAARMEKMLPERQR